VFLTSCNYLPHACRTCWAFVAWFAASSFSSSYQAKLVALQSSVHGGRQHELATARRLRTKGVGQGFEVCYRRTEEADHGLQDVAKELQDG